MNLYDFLSVDIVELHLPIAVFLLVLLKQAPDLTCLSVNVLLEG